MFKKVLSASVVAVMVAGLLTGCLPSSTAKTPTSTTTGTGSTAGKTVIKISNGVSDTHPSVVAQKEKFKKIVEEKTNGRYSVEVYANNQLGDDTKATEGLRAGTIEMNNTSTAPLVGVVPQLGIFDIPFLFPNAQVADKVLDGAIGQKLADLMPAQGLVLLAWNENGFRHLTNSIKDVKTPADLKGLKIRTMQNKFHLDAWKLLGANPTPMSWSEVFTALQQKAIDGQENPIANSYSARIQEVNKHWTLTGHVYSPFMLNISKKVWDKMSAEDQQIFKDAAHETALYERQLNRDAESKDLELLKGEGVTVTQLTPDQKKAFQDLTAPVWDEVSQSVGADLITQLKAAIADASK